MGNFVNWDKDSIKDDYYINEEGMYELVFARQQPNAKAFKKYCCNTVFPHIWQQLTNKMVGDHQQAITGIQREHQLLLQTVTTK